MQHMESRRACALVNAATPCKVLSAHHSLRLYEGMEFTSIVLKHKGRQCSNIDQF